MSLFVDKNKRLKSPLVMICFCAALLFMLVYGVVYWFLTEPLYLYLPLGGGTAATVLHAVIMSAVGTAVCCLLFFAPDKRVVPGAYACLAVLLAVFYLAVLLLDAENRGSMLRLITLFGSAPVVIGNAAAWPIYLKIRSAHPAPQNINLRAELRSAAAAAKASAPAPAPTPAPAPEPSEPPAITEEEALFGPEAGGGAERTFRSAQEEAMLFYDDETNDD